MNSIIWRLVGATVFGILGFTALIMTSIIGLAESDISMLPYVTVSILATATCVRSIVKLNKEYKTKLAEKIRSATEFISEWECPKEEWSTFIREQQVVSVKDAKSTAIWTAGIVMVIFFFIFRNEMSNLAAVAAAFGAGVFLGALIYVLMKTASRVKFAKYAKTTTGKIAFSKQVIQINEQLIDWSLKMNSLEGVVMDETFECTVMLVTVKQHAGSRSNVHTHAVPIPSERLEEARKIVEYYQLSL